VILVDFTKDIFSREESKKQPSRLFSTNRTLDRIEVSNKKNNPKPYQIQK